MRLGKWLPTVQDHVEFADVDIVICSALMTGLGMNCHATVVVGL